MSALVCEHCERLIDLNTDPHCVCENPYDSRDITIVCENCREAAYDRQQERLMEGGGGPSLLEQQRAAMKFK